MDFMLWELDLAECDETKEFCYFLLQVILLEFNLQKYKPSVLAAAALQCASQLIESAEGAFGPTVDDLALLITRH